MNEEETVELLERMALILTNVAIILEDMDNRIEDLEKTVKAHSAAWKKLA